MPQRTRKRPLAAPPAWVPPQLARLVKEAPNTPEWLHEIKYDGYRLHARIEDGDVKLLTRTGLDWTRKYQATAQALSDLEVVNAYIDGELCALRADGTTDFSALQAATDKRASTRLVYFAFDLLFLGGKDISGQADAMSPDRGSRGCQSPRSGG